MSHPILAHADCPFALNPAFYPLDAAGIMSGNDRMGHARVEWRALDVAERVEAGPAHARVRSRRRADTGYLVLGRHHRYTASGAQTLR